MGFLHPDTLPDEPLYLLRKTGDPEDFTRNHDIVQIDDIPVHDVRSARNPPTLEKEGFTFMEAETQMSYDDYHDEAKIKNLFGNEIKSLLQSTLSAKWNDLDMLE